MCGQTRRNPNKHKYAVFVDRFGTIIIINNNKKLFSIPPLKATSESASQM